MLDPRLRKTRERRAQSDCLRQTIPDRNPAILEPAFRRARHPEAEFSLDILGAKSGRIFLDNEPSDFSIVLFRPNNFDVGDRHIADPAFAAIQNVMITVARRARFHAAGI